MSTLLLNTESLTFLALSLSLSLLSFFFFFSYTSPRSTKTPCPQSHPIIGNLIAFLRNRHRFHDWIAEMLTDTPSSTLQADTFLNLSHGICTANPKNVEHILLTNFPNYIKGSRFQDILSELLGDGIFNVDDHLWITQRKISSYEFSTKSLRNFIADVVCSQIRTRLLPYLRDNATDSSKNGMTVVDLQQILQEFTFNNICSVAFGVDPSSLKSKDFFNAFDDAVEICTSRILSPLPILWKVKRYLNLGSEKRLKQDLKIIDDYAMEIIKSKEQVEGGEGEGEEELRRDLLSRFMSNSNLEFGDQNQKRKFLRDIIISFVMAGKDSTSTALTWFFWLIAGNPRCESLIRTELAQLAPEGSRSFSYNDLKKLNYLHAALSESMRLFPPVPINSRLTVKDDVLPDGTHVKKGWFADYSAYAMGRSEKVWGKDYMEFRPERWLVYDDDDHRVYQPFDQFKFPVFHCGPRICLGKEMAYLQMKSIVASLMLEFEIVAVDGGATLGRMMEPPYTLSLLLKMRGGLPVSIRRRHL